MLSPGLIWLGDLSTVSRQEEGMSLRKSASRDLGKMLLKVKCPSFDVCS
jgi:hypothetical protein